MLVSREKSYLVLKRSSSEVRGRAGSGGNGCKHEQDNHHHGFPEPNARSPHSQPRMSQPYEKPQTIAML